MSETATWQPSASIPNLLKRAAIIAEIRRFFADRGVLEVETPCMSQATVTDIHLFPFETRFVGPGHSQGMNLYLMTSPEYHMKRLLVAGCGPVYQLCRSFRNEEMGRHHNPEFTMLEWYRPTFSLSDLMHETSALLNVCLAERFSELRPMVLSYKHAFQDRLDINPLQATLEQLKETARRVGLNLDLGDDRLAYMDLLFSHMVEPSLGFDTPVFLTDFPPEMASLAKVKTDEDGEQVAARFEVYIEGLELANAYDELVDADVLRQRFTTDNAERAAQGLTVMPIDEHLLAALPHMPECSGIALGIDRLLMIAQNKLKLEQVITFPAEIA